MAKPRLILNRYRPVATAGTGGFATVYKAWDNLIQRHVAIKEIKLSEMDAQRATRPSILLPWEDEQEAAARIAAEQAGLAGSAGYGAGAAGAAGPNGAGSAGTAGAGNPGNPNATGATAAGQSRFGLPQTAPLPRDPEFLGGGYPVIPEEQPALNREGSQPQRFLSNIPGLDEARTACFLDDPCIVKVHDLQIQDSTAYLIMEYVEGVSLTKFLQDYEDQLTLDMIASIFADTAHAIQTAHANNVLHLDIKPDNILINMQGRVKMTDFGLAMLSDCEESGAAGGGTIGYMPLEQMRQEQPDQRTDEWALASVTYEMLLGQNPFLANDLDSAEFAIQNAELVLPHLLWDELEPAADDVLFYALDPNPANRYETVQDFAEEMSRFLGSPAAGRAQLEALLAGAEQEEPSEPQVADHAPQRPGLLARLFSCKPTRSAAGRQGEKGEESARSQAQHEPPAQHAPSLPPSQSLSPTAVMAAGRVGSACMCAFMNAFSLMNLPRVEAFPPQAMWAALAVGLAACLVRPHLGTLVSYLVLGVSLCASGAPAFGVLLIAATCPWWWAVGRHGSAAANLAMAFPVLGAVGLAPAAACATGVFLSAGRAAATTALGALACLGLACVSTLSLTGWDALTNFMLPGILADVQPHVMQMVSNPGTWLVAVSWILAAAVVAACCKPGWKWLAVLGTLLGAAALVAGLAAAQLAGSGLEQLQLSPFELVPAGLSLVFCAATCCMEVPRRRR